MVVAKPQGVTHLVRHKISEKLTLLLLAERQPVDLGINIFRHQVIVATEPLQDAGEDLYMRANDFARAGVVDAWPYSVGRLGWQPAHDVRPSVLSGPIWVLFRARCIARDNGIAKARGLE